MPSPYINRFIQPDTIIPNPSNPQSLNRFSYVQNNPINFSDPTGHYVFCDDDDWACQTHWDEPITYDDSEYSVELTEDEGEVVEFLYDASEIVISIFNEPIDWMLTYDDYKRNGLNPWMLLGMFPFIPSRGASKLFRYIHPNDILPDGGVMSRAFRDPTMSVFDEALGATPELVLEVQSKSAGLPGKGAVMGIDSGSALSVNGVDSIVQELGTTGNHLLDEAHKVILNLGTKSVAQRIRDIATWLIP